MEEEKLKIALKDKAFAEKIVKLQTPEEVQAAFKEKGVEISMEEIQLLGSLLNKMVESGEPKLSEKDLEEVVGGGGLWARTKFRLFKAGFEGKPLITKDRNVSYEKDRNASYDFAREALKYSDLGEDARIATEAAGIIAVGVGLYYAVPWAYKKAKTALNLNPSEK